MTLEKDPHFEEKMSFYLKNDTGNFVKFNLSTWKSESLHFHGQLLKKICNVRATKIQRSCVVKNDLSFQEWHP